MTTKQLEVLLIDQSLGELSDEASELLEAFLALSPDRRAEAEQVRHAVACTGAAVASQPLPLEAGEPIPFPVRSARFSPLLRVAAAIALLGLAAGAGFFAGQGGSELRTRAEGIASSPESSASSPWARYRVEENGRLAVILPSDSKS